MSRAESIAAILLAGLLLGCHPSARTGDAAAARNLFEQTVRNCHLPSAEAKGAERDRLLAGAAEGYTQLLDRYPGQTYWCAQALRSLAGVRVEQGRFDDAMTLFRRVGDHYSQYDWEVLQAWKSAADLLWDAGRHDEAKAFYRRIVDRFATANKPSLFRTIVTVAHHRLAGTGNDGARNSGEVGSAG